MNTESLIKSLKESKFYAECPNCNEEFKLSEALLFDGTKSFPPEALKIQEIYTAVLKQKEDDLKKRKKLATEKAKITTASVNIGKNLEKVVPLMSDFTLDLPDCRFLGDPIDIITFNGFSLGSIDSMSFIEVKSGKARLNAHQKSVRDAVEDKKVSYRIFK